MTPEIKQRALAILGELDEQQKTYRGFLTAREQRIREHIAGILRGLDRRAALELVRPKQSCVSCSQPTGGGNYCASCWPPKI